MKYTKRLLVFSVLLFSSSAFADYSDALDGDETRCDHPSRCHVTESAPCSYDYNIEDVIVCDMYGCHPTSRSGTLTCSEGAIRVSIPGVGSLDCATCQFTPEIPPTPRPSVTPRINPSLFPPYTRPTCPGGNCPLR